jgi:hypothetical protein
MILDEGGGRTENHGRIVGFDEGGHQGRPDIRMIIELSLNIIEDR